MHAVKIVFYLSFGSCISLNNRNDLYEHSYLDFTTSGNSSVKYRQYKKTMMFVDEAILITLHRVVVSGCFVLAKLYIRIPVYSVQCTVCNIYNRRWALDINVCLCVDIKYALVDKCLIRFLLLFCCFEIFFVLNVCICLYAFALFEFKYFFSFSLKRNNRIYFVTYYVKTTDGADCTAHSNFIEKLFYVDFASQPFRFLDRKEPHFIFDSQYICFVCILTHAMKIKESKNRPS